jgi:hypothetical protein
MSTTTETTETGTVTTETAPVQGTGLGVNDLKLMARVIQVSAERGAFKADELQVVGGLYNRTIEFLRATGNLDPVQAPEGGEAPAEGDEAPADDAGEEQDSASEE